MTNALLVYAMAIIIACLLVMLTGCETIRVEPPQKVEVPVAVSCLPKDMPVAPILYSDVELAKLDDFKLPLALRQNSELAVIYARELEAVLRGCK